MPSAPAATDVILVLAAATILIAPAERPPVPEGPPVVFTDGPCPPGYERVSVDGIDAAGRFAGGFSYCERRGPERPWPPAP